MESRRLGSCSSGLLWESQNLEELERIGVEAFRDLLVDLPETEKISST